MCVCVRECVFCVNSCTFVLVNQVNRGVGEARLGFELSIRQGGDGYAVAIGDDARLDEILQHRLAAAEARMTVSKWLLKAV